MAGFYSQWTECDCQWAACGPELDDSPAVQQSAMAINDFAIDSVSKALSDTGSTAPHFALLAKGKGMLRLCLICAACFQSLGPKLKSIAGSQSQNERKSDAMRGPTPVWNYKGFLPLPGHQMQVFAVNKQLLRWEFEEASGTIATTLLSHERDYSLASLYCCSCLHCTLSCASGVAGVEVTEVSGSRKLILTVDLKHCGEPVDEPVPWIHQAPQVHAISNVGNLT